VSSSSTFFICPLASWIRLPLVKWAGWESAGVSRYLLPPTPSLAAPLSFESAASLQEEEAAGPSLEVRVHCFSFSCFGCCCTLLRPLSCLSCSCCCSCNLCRCQGLPPLSGECGAFRLRPAEAGGRSVGCGRGGRGWKEEGPYWGRWYGILTGRESREGWKAGRGK